jgi:hypothetical protein
MRSLGIIVFGIAAAATPIFSQAPAETRPSFEVASIKTRYSGHSGVARDKAHRYLQRFKNNLD